MMHVAKNHNKFSCAPPMPRNDLHIDQDAREQAISAAKQAIIRGVDLRHSLCRETFLLWSSSLSLVLLSGRRRGPRRRCRSHNCRAPLQSSALAAPASRPALPLADRVVVRKGGTQAAAAAQWRGAAHVQGRAGSAAGRAQAVRRRFPHAGRQLPAHSPQSQQRVFSVHPGRLSERAGRGARAQARACGRAGRS